jgi:hypothetical protein
MLQYFLTDVHYYKMEVYTGCEGYWRPFLKIVHCSSRLHNGDVIQAVDTSILPLHRANIKSSETITRLLQQSLRGATVTWICAGRSSFFMDGVVFRVCKKFVTQSFEKSLIILAKTHKILYLIL